MVRIKPARLSDKDPERVLMNDRVQHGQARFFEVFWYVHGVGFDGREDVFPDRVCCRAGFVRSSSFDIYRWTS